MSTFDHCELPGTWDRVFKYPREIPLEPETRLPRGGKYETGACTAMNEIEQKYRELVETTDTGFVILKGDGTVVDANSQYVRLTGHESLADIMNRSVIEWTAPYDRERNALAVKVCLEQGRIRDLEIDYAGPGGAVTTVEINATVYGKGGELRILSLCRDISGRKLMERSLHESERWNRSLIAAMPDLMFVLSRDGVFLDFKAEKSEELLFPPSEILGKNIRDMAFMPDQRALVLEKIESALKTKAVTEFEYFLSMAEDSEIWSARMIAMDDDKVLVLVRDITERARAEEKLRNANRQLSDIIEFLPDATFIIDAEKKIIAWNRAIEVMTGVEKKDILGMDHHYSAVPFYGRPRSYIMDLLDNDDPALVARYDYVRRNGNVIYAEVFVPSLYGNRGAYIFIAASRLFDGEGAIIGSIESIRDITERKRAEEALRASEERYRALYRDNPTMYFTLDTEGTVVSVNDFGASQLGYSIEELVGRPVLQVFYEPDKSEVVRKLGICLENPGETFRWQFRKIRKNGSILWVDEVARAVHSPDGVISVLVVCSDVTEQKIAEEEKQRLQDELRQAQKMDSIGRLTGGIAHDFNNLLTAIMGNSSLALLDLSPNDPLHATLTEIHKASVSAASLTKQLLAFSRKQIIEPQMLDINRALGEMQRMLKRIIGEDITLTTNLRDDIGIVRIDPGQFEQIIINLVVNSRDAMQDGGALTIETAHADLDDAYCASHAEVAPGPYLKLTVRDSGCGMSAETLEHLFEPFYTTKGRGKGTGLGLATVYGSVKQNKGSIEIESEPGKGTTVTIFLPAAAGAAAAGAVHRAAMGPATGTETVMLVEDEPVVRDFTIKVLRRFGYTVLHYPDAESALEAAKRTETKIDLLVTDVVLPGMNGRVLARRIANIRPGIKVLFSSGYTDDVILRHGIFEEGLHFIGKPYAPEAFARKIREVLDEKA